MDNPGLIVTFRKEKRFYQKNNWNVHASVNESLLANHERSRPNRINLNKWRMGLLGPFRRWVAGHLLFYSAASIARESRMRENGGQ